MKKKKIKELGKLFFEKNNRYPTKSELRRLKKNYKTGITVRVIDWVLPKPVNLSIMNKDESKIREKETRAVAEHVLKEHDKHKESKGDIEK